MTMRITKGNYEAYLLDYAEGRLDEATVRELEAFLDRNPDLRAEWESFEPVYLDEDPAPEFPRKEALFNGNITLENYEAYLLDHTEGNLGESEVAELEGFLHAHPEAARQFEGFRPVYLQPAPLVSYPHKAALRRGAVVVPMWRRPAMRWVAGVAAVLLFSLPLVRTLVPGTEVPMHSVRGLSALPEITVTPLAPADSAAIPGSIDVPGEKQEHVPQYRPAQQDRLVAVQQPETDGEMPEGSYQLDIPAPMGRMEVAEVKSSRPVYGSGGIARYQAPELLDGESYSSKGTDAKPTGAFGRFANELARGFLPEDLADVQPEDILGDRKTLPNTIIIELPKGGKKIFDSIFKPE
jgi:anti-sigma factor RsiW